VKRLRIEIEATFAGKAFLRPLFYSYPAGLRFELSEGGSALEQFLLALNKASRICTDIFPPEGSVVACLRLRAGNSSFSHRCELHELEKAGIKISHNRSIWLEPVPPEDWFEEAVEEFWLNVAFEISASLLQNLLWCSFSTDFPAIHPRPRCMVYLFNLELGIMVWPYDDRGMDIVGPNHEVLAKLYQKYNQFLLDYDRPIMDKNFKNFELP
jgi:hypothetical protein